MRVILCFLTVLFVPSLVGAQVVVNEVAWMGTPTEGVDGRQEWRYEWLELYNAGEEAVSLQDWKIELYDEEGLDFTIGLYKTIEAGGYLVVGASSAIPGADIHYDSLVGKFTNDGERVVLKNAAGEVVEEIDASSGWFAGDNDSKLTMERRFPDKEPGSEESWGSSVTTGGTPGDKNSVFGKEALTQLGAQNLSAAANKTESPGGLSAGLLVFVANPVFILALLLAGASALSILLLRGYLVKSREAD